SPHLARIATLRVQGVRESDVLDVARCSQLRHLRSLELQADRSRVSSPFEQGIAALAASSALTNLRHLVLTDHVPLHASDLAALADSPRAAGLRRLSLTMPLMAGGIDSFTRSPAFSHLESLAVSVYRSGKAGRRLAELVASEALPSLRFVRFSGLAGGE